MSINREISGNNWDIYFSHRKWHVVSIAAILVVMAVIYVFMETRSRGGTFS